MANPVPQNISSTWNGWFYSILQSAKSGTSSVISTVSTIAETVIASTSAKLNGPDVAKELTAEESLKSISNNFNAFKSNQPENMRIEKPVARLEMDPQKARALDVEQKLTNELLKTFLNNASVFASANFIFANRLGLLNLKNTRDYNLLTSIVRNARNPGSDVWQVSIKTLEGAGIYLTLFQWIQAKFWYFLSDTLGLIPNFIKEVGKNVLADVRKDIQNENSSSTAIEQILKEAKEFLISYKGAIEAYAKPENTRTLLDLKKEAIGRLGDVETRAIATQEQVKLSGEESFEKTMLKALCKRFVKHLVDDETIFPSIQFFDSVKNFRLFQVRFGAIFDVMEYIFGTPVNILAKYVIKAYAPEIVFNSCKEIIEQASPRKFAFKTGIANVFTEQLKVLENAFSNGIPSKPRRLETNAELQTVVSEFFKTVNLDLCGDNKEAICEELHSPQFIKKRVMEALQTVAANGAHILVDYFTTNPEALEQLLGKFVNVSNQLFGDEPPTTAKNYESALEVMEKAANALVEPQVKEAVHGTFVENPQKIRIILEGVRSLQNPTLFVHNERNQPIHRGLIEEHREKAISCINALKQLPLIGNANFEALASPPLKDLDSYMETINELIKNKESLNLDLYGYKKVETTFNKTFQSIYQDFKGLTDRAVALQKPLKSYEKSKQLVALFNSIATEENPTGQFLDQEFFKLQKIDIDPSFSGLENEQIGAIEAFAKLGSDYIAKETELSQLTRVITNLPSLENLDQLINEAHLDPTLLISRLKNRHFEELASSIEALEREAPLPFVTSQTRKAFKQAYSKMIAGLLMEIELQSEEKAQKLQEIRNFSKGNHENMTRIKNIRLEQIKKKLSEVRTVIYALESTTKVVKMSDMSSLASSLLRPILNIDPVLQPSIIATVNQLMKQTYKLTTSEEFVEGLVRLKVGEFIEKHEKLR